MNELISVIVPIYNVERYIRRCVDSVLAQTYSNLEILLVDDGSPDNCGKICDEYAEKDQRIKVIHKENGGLSDARNAALDVMNGEYVTFIDSDDFVSKYYVENLYRALTDSNADMASSWFIDFYDGDPIPEGKRLKSVNIQTYDAAHYLERMLYQDGVEISAWGKLYKSEAFSSIRYPKGKLYEDIPVTSRIAAGISIAAVIPNVDYIYYQRAVSIQNMEFNPKKMDAIEHMTRCNSMIKGRFPEISRAADCRLFSSTCNIFFQVDPKKNPVEWSVLWKLIKQLRKTILLDSKARKKARAAALLSYLGYPVMRSVYDRAVK